MSTCGGDLTVATKTDQSMREFVKAEADRLGVTPAEFLRRLLELYRESRRETVKCPNCGETVSMDLRT